MNDYGNPGQDMEGDEPSGGGILDIVAAAGGPATFTYSGLDYAAYDSRGAGVQTLSVTGLLGGSIVGPGYLLANTDGVPLNWTTEHASTLSGKTIDDLQITLSAGEGDSFDFVQTVDNISLGPAATSVPGGDPSGDYNSRLGIPLNIAVPSAGQRF